MKILLPKRCRITITISLLLGLAATASFGQTHYYVNQAIATSGNGSSWATAFKTLQEAIDKTSSEVVDEIWVAKGTYLPTKNSYGTLYEPPSFSKQQTFYLKKAMKIYGGFAGTETNLNERNWESNETILSANRGLPEDSTDNFYHVILAIGSEAKPLGNNLVIDGFTITGGYANFQGSIQVDGATVYSYNGGGIYNIYASPTLKNLKIIKNVGFVGGGIHNNRSAPLISNVLIADNYSGANGGGLYNYLSAPILTDVIVSGNTVNNDVGGGIYNNATTIELTNVTISKNKCFRGGGISSVGSTVKMTNVVIKENAAKTDGGGILNELDVKMTLNNVEVTDNTAQYGAGMNSSGATIGITGGNFSRNKAAYYGGAMFLDSDTITFAGATISDNEATTYQGGGLFVDEDARLIFTNSIVSGNKAKTDAGGILCRNGAIVQLNDVTVSKNTSGRYGGGIYIAGTSDPLIQPSFYNVTISENIAFDGGGMYLNGSTPSLKYVTFNNNTADDAGGGLFNALGGNPNLNFTFFQNNKAANGGGMFSQSGALPTITNTSYVGNEATGEGGGVYNDYNGSFTNVIFSGNKAEDGGGMSNGASPVLTNVIFSGNLATNTGGGIFQESAAPILTNVTFGGNNATVSGGAMYMNGSGATKIRNCIMYGNSTGLSFINGLPSISNSLIQGRTATTNGNITGETDPLFIDAPDFSTAPFTNGDYRLQTTSPVINKGENSLYDAGMSPDLSTINTDLFGLARIYASIVDMGAYEDQPGSLPINVLSFKAEKQTNNVNLAWQVADEINVAFYEIQRSTDAQNFVAVGQVKASGIDNYQFNDATADENKTFYYRLRIQGKNGTFIYSNIAVLNLTRTMFSKLTVYPNPAANYLIITEEGNRQIKVNTQLIDAAGKVVLETKINPIDVRRIQPGIYLLRIKRDDSKNIETRKVFISRP